MSAALRPKGTAALALGALGVHVFPIEPGAKSPPLVKVWQLKATTDAAQIEAWWEATPEANIAAVPDLSGCFVADLDVKKGKDGIAALKALEPTDDPLPETLTIRTPSGGVHLWFKGQVPSSTGADGIDFKGGAAHAFSRGYVVMAPSVLEDVGSYSVEVDAPIAEAPPWLLELGHSRHKRSDQGVVGQDVDLDKPVNVARFTRFAALFDAPLTNQNDAGAQLVAFSQDFGVSRRVAWPIIVEQWGARCSPPIGLYDRLVEAGVWQARQNVGAPLALREPGELEPVGVLGSNENITEWVERLGIELTADEALPTVEPACDERVARFRGREPDEWATLPEPTFHDDHGLLLKAPGGVVGVLAGPSGSYKTTVMLALGLDAARNKGARVLYMAPEGAYGLGKLRVPAECTVRGIEPKELRGRFRQLDTAPILTDPRDVDALLEAQADFRPNLVVIDTMASALGSLDENAASTAALLTGTGPLRRIAHTWNATVMLLAHLGKDETKGIRGSSAFEGNADTVLMLKADKTAGTIKLRVKKQRDARDGFDVHFKIISPAGVPVARFITGDEAKALSPCDASNVETAVFRALRRLRRADPDATVTTVMLASALVPLVEGQNPADRERLIANEEKHLQALTRPNRRTQRPGPLLAYVEADQWGEIVKPLRWVFPDDGGDDD